ncbi:MAG: NADH-quinone oxidoreductase subunit I [Syntrophobacterales bacterium CG_4_8_14_3_um_filter_58_8]|nr:MAG: NADH-quinone oxidoreductase subunit I [Syntrophaceae bacterium CG2_30_58_14]PIV06011.1 MAG: NADH-quinone oxidoreductase subunit I [Syntrophobacterales bacterium CG03_land_8_20_14_0_80_58_14]PJC75048.1 MAG: NADH-quinone oxidoreductase subunit I [Syntrophobacterales bacterium CG_4_8_14_3_um_filter_58_8]
MTASPSAFIKGAGSLIAGLGVTIKAFFQPVVTSQYPRQLLNISPRFRSHTKLVADRDNPEKNGCIACGICVRNCPSGSIKKVEGEKREGEKRKTATSYLLDFTTCSQCGICVETCPSAALDFSADFNLAGFKREDFHFDLVKEFEKRKKTS